MNDPLPPPETPLETVAYQPISPWAIVGFAVSILFTCVVAISAVVGILKGAPVFFPLWIMVLAVAGFALSWIGLRHVQNSEGTRAGARLARAGMWLSLLSGLSYFSYSYATGLALQNQANEFLMDMGEDSGFFPRLLQGEDNPSQLNAAFLLTLPATSRSGRPEDEASMMRLYDAPGKDGAPGNLSQFREGVFARMFSGGLAKDAEISKQTVQDWTYEQHSYKIIRNYRIHTKEVDMDVRMAVHSTEAESAGQARKWFVNLKESYPIAKTLTPIGEGVKLLRNSAQEALRKSIASLQAGTPWSDFAAKDRSNWNRLLQKFSEEDRSAVRAAVTKLFTAGEKQRFYPLPSSVGDLGNWTQVDGKVRIDIPFRLGLPPNTNAPAIAFVSGYAVLETRQAQNPAQFESTSDLPEWDMIRVVLTQVTPPPERKAPP